ncbi:MAG: undecaprenyl-diphosphatase [Candidatus Micrarchaeota archaeon]|nr:undecaprenyl-diphosphatase [Candidatus Micrarchaeota archaeon]
MPKFALLAVSFQHVFYGVVLGIVQGISEWLPISSKTQIIIVSEALLKLNFSQAYAFGLFMEIGTISAAIIYFRKELWSLIKVIIGRGNKLEWMLFKYVLVSMVFTGIIGAPLYLVVDSITGSYNVGIPMVLVGAVLIIDAIVIKYARKREAIPGNRKKLEQMGLKDYAVVGIAQGIAALPGVSRSGMTTSTLLLLNVDTSEAFRLSFIDMIFATSSAVALTLVASRASISSSIALVGGSGIAISIIIATIISLFLIDFLLKIARKSSIIYLTAGLGVIAILGGILAAIYGVV